MEARVYDFSPHGHTMKAKRNIEGLGLGNGFPVEELYCIVRYQENLISAVMELRKRIGDLDESIEDVSQVSDSSDVLHLHV
eukprot:334647-Amorphochlora_amoeboformis.AAC.2